MAGAVLITGASSGLGLAFLKHYAQSSYSPPSNILALDITPLPPDADTLPNVSFHKADVSSESSLASIAQNLANTPIRLLIHSAGIRGLVPSIVKSNPGDVDAAETYTAMDHGTMMRTLEINTFGTFNVVKTFLPNLKLCEGSKAVILSSRMGSISSNVGGGGYAYRTSKAALNAVMKSFSIDVPEVVFLLLHPGRVETGLVEWKEDGAMSVDESLEDCIKVVDSVGKGDSGRFVDRWGTDIGW